MAIQWRKVDRQPGRPARQSHGRVLRQVGGLGRAIGFGGQLADDPLNRQARTLLVLRVDRKNAVVDRLACGVAHHLMQRYPFRHVAKEGGQ